MKTVRNISLIGLTIMFVLTSCTMEKRVYRSGYHTEWLTAKHQGHSGAYKNCSLCTPKDEVQQSGENTAMIVEQQTPERDITKDNTIIADDNMEIVASVDNSELLSSSSLFPTPKIYFNNKSEVKKNTISKECDVIILKNGQEIKAKVLEVGATEIKYKLCDNLDGPTFSKNKSEVFMIKYPNGTSTVISEFDTKSTASQESGSGEKKTEPLSLISFISSLVGLFIFGIVFGIASVIMSAIGLGKINKNPEKWKGKGFAIAGIIIGIIDILAFFIILALLL